MKHLITSSNLTFTKKNCNCNITSNALDTKTKSYKRKSYKSKNSKKSKQHKK